MREPRDAPDILVLPPVLVGGTMLLGVALHYGLWPIQLLPVILSRVAGVTIFIASGVLAHLSHLAMKRYLARKFGQSYEAYRSLVPRWL